MEGEYLQFMSNVQRQGFRIIDGTSKHATLEI